ncbi:hypothetical protein HJG60_010306 [Phyllostomus discolor]|uniref:Uncharacterized protein n=1 Tax=Phyllostomus discolor TaxID=89673 RepID=A0A834AZV3_9CHIR|nr:hypothetical protein HJG60_010306 [Phyllostomus discolor]
MLCQLAFLHSVQLRERLPELGGALCLGLFSPRGVLVGAPWAQVSLQESEHESGRLETSPMLWGGVPSSPPVTLVTSGEGLGFSLGRWPQRGGLRSVHVHQTLCRRHKGLGSCRQSRTLLLQSTGALLQPV